MRILDLSLFSFILFCVFTSCQQHTPDNKQKIEESVSIPDAENFRDTIEGHEVSLYTLRNSKGMEVALTIFGARIVSIIVPDKDSIKCGVVVCFAKASDYYNKSKPYSDPVDGPY